MESILVQQKSERVKLRKAEYSDEDVVVNILCKSFENDPHLNWMLEKSKYPDKLKAIMTYTFQQTMKIGNIYLTDDETATAMWTSEKNEKFSFEFIKRNLKFLFQVGIQTVVRILTNESFTHKQYPKGEKYYHLYIIGVLPESQGKGYANLLMNPILYEMEERSIPVYLETANPRNVQIYLKKGFKTYKTWIKNGLKLYYMRTC
jgi:GNAT superfamily N-acetyltransferase